jgi:hypothetical protein
MTDEQISALIEVIHEQLRGTLHPPMRIVLNDALRAIKELRARCDELQTTIDQMARAW